MVNVSMTLLQRLYEYITCPKVTGYKLKQYLSGNMKVICSLV